MPLHGDFPESEVPAAGDHLAFLPIRLVAVAGNTLGTVAVVAIALLTPRRPVGNGLIVGAVALADAGSAFAGRGEAATGSFLAGCAVLLYAGVRSDR